MRTSVASRGFCLATFAALLLSMIVPACGSSAAQGSGPDGGAVGSGGGGGGDGAAPPILGGDGGPSSTGDGGCTGLQCKQQPCSGNATTSISGTVYDPAGANPLYNVVVYVPNATPAAITPGIDASSCSCDALYTGQPIATALTDATGH
ncbi:MAG TPA: carboxypeptidase regulatory-like domain-containing protein, partial [Polyangiaceae bacterium]